MHGWSGSASCTITVTGQGYQHSETQRWQLAGPTTVRGSFQFVPSHWTDTGSGSSHQTQGDQTNDITWTVKAAAAGQFEFVVRGIRQQARRRAERVRSSASRTASPGRSSRRSEALRRRPARSGWRRSRPNYRRSWLARPRAQRLRLDAAHAGVRIVRAVSSRELPRGAVKSCTWRFARAA